MSTETKPAFSWDEYAAIPRMNASTLVHGCKSMRHLRHAMKSGFEPTPAMVRGSQIHSLALEPEDFERTHIVAPDFANHEENVDANGKRSRSGNTTWCRVSKQQFYWLAEGAGQQVMDRADYDLALCMIEAINADPQARELMRTCEKEVSLLGEIDGVEFKGRVDLIKRGVVPDIKTTPSTEAEKFGTSACNLRYDIKMGIYRELARQNGYGNCSMLFIAVETEPPWDVTVYEAPEPWLDHGYSKARQIIAGYKFSLERDEWPGCGGTQSVPMPMFIPNWAMPGDECI